MAQRPVHPDATIVTAPPEGMIRTREVIDKMGLGNFLHNILLDSVDGDPDLEDLEEISDVLGSLFSQWLSRECIHHLEDHRGYACADRIIECCDEFKPAVRMHLSNHCQEKGIRDPFGGSTHNQEVTQQILLDMERDDDTGQTDE